MSGPSLGARKEECYGVLATYGVRELWPGSGHDG